MFIKHMSSHNGFWALPISFKAISVSPFLMPIGNDRKFSGTVMDSDNEIISEIFGLRAKSGRSAWISANRFINCKCGDKESLFS